MVTALDPDPEIAALSFDDYLVKPVSNAEIRDAVERMLVRERCDEAIRGIVALASKMATLESKMTIEELNSSEKYAALETRLDDLRQEVHMGDPSDNVYAEFTTEKIRSLFGCALGGPADTGEDHESRPGVPDPFGTFPESTTGDGKR